MSEGEQPDLSGLPNFEPREISEEQIQQEETELGDFRKKLLPYYRRYMVHAATVTDPESPSHPNKMRETGLMARSIRKHIGLTRADIAQQIEVDPVQLAAFEGGLIPLADLPQGFPQKLASILRERLGQLPPTPGSN